MARRDHADENEPLSKLPLEGQQAAISNFRSYLSVLKQWGSRPMSGAEALLLILAFFVSLSEPVSDEVEQGS